jgi:RNA polymerase sigma-70 factor (ECF subfamily)
METLEGLSEAMRLIGHDQRALLILRDMQSLDYKQIAELLEVPVGTVKSRLFRARVALREQIEALERPEGHGVHGPPG